MDNTVRLVVAAAAAVVLALIGYQLLIAPNVGDPPPSPSPSAAEPVNFTDEGEGTALRPGEYVIDYAAPAALVTFTVPDEPYRSGAEEFPSPWYKAGFDWGPWHQSNSARLGVAQVENLFLDPCDPAAGLRDPAVGPTVADLVTALGEVPGLEVRKTAEAEISGFAAQYVEITGQRPTDCVEDPVIWTTAKGDPSLLMPDTGDLDLVWVFDVEGQRLVIWGGVDQEFDDPPDLDVLLDTIAIEVP